MPRTMTEADRAMIQALAEVVVLDRLERQQIDLEWVDPRGKGRCKFRRDPEHLEPTQAEQKWMELQAQFASGQLQWEKLVAPTQQGSEEDPA